ncbi:protein phosphatase 1 regulatory subunit 42 [Verrucomicrobia bacterium]|nr:protein phosphatase 1 regulatory subunit 42 [Verrucomicrobiota bacterium]
MKQILLMIVAVVGCSNDTRKAAPDPVLPANEKLIADPIVEKAVREELEKPEGELTKADLGKVRYLYLHGLELTEVPKGLEKLTRLKVIWLSGNKLTDVKGLEKLTKLVAVNLQDNPDLTKSQISELQKALPNCKIGSDTSK